MADHSDLGFQPVSTPHDDLGFTPNYQIGASESRIGHHLETHPAKIIPSMVDAIVSPIASIPAAAKEVYGYFTHPNDFMARKMDASQAASVPGAMSVNPPADAYTTALAAASAAKGTPKPDVTIPRSMGEAFGGEYTPPTASAGGLPPSVLHKLGRYAASKLIPGGGIAYDLARNAASDLTAPKPPAPPTEALAVPAAPVDPILEHIARAKANVQAQAAPPKAVPRPPEYYGVQAPPAQVAPLPTQAPPVAPEAAPIGRIAEIDATLKHISETAPGTSPSYSAAIDSLLRERDSLAAAPAEVAAQPTAAPAAAEAPATVAKRITPGVKDANTLAAKFGDWGFSPSEAAGMNDAGWAKLAHDAGVKFPSAAVRDRAIRQLRSNLAGPEVPVTELIDKLKASFAENPKTEVPLPAEIAPQEPTPEAPAEAAASPKEIAKRPTRTAKVSTKEPGEMTGAEVNKELDRLSAESSKITNEMIEAGRGNEKPSQTQKLDDPLAQRWKANVDRMGSLHNEIRMRYGPSAPSRLPKGFGPRVKK